MGKTIAIIDGVEYAVGFPECRGCENLCFPAPLTCVFVGNGCEYPDERSSFLAPPAVSEEGDCTCVLPSQSCDECREAGAEAAGPLEEIF